MNMFERFEQPSATENSERKEAIAHVFETSERVNDVLSEELVVRHSNKIFHDPTHTLGNNSETPDLTYVRGGVLVLTDLVKQSFEKSLKGRDSEVELMVKGMEAGAVAHDVVIELNGVAPNGVIMRRRGWAEGGNERESFHHLRRRFLKEYIGAEEELTLPEEEMIHGILTDEDAPEFDPEYKRYMDAAERMIAGTEPDVFNFGYELDEEKYVSEYPEDVQRLLRSPNWTEEKPQYFGVMIDSTKTALSLESLLGSTADLGAFTDPEVFARTGNAEFWELQYGVSKECAEFLKNPNSMEPVRVSSITEQMQVWRQTQVRVAVAQRARLEEHYTKENITTLFENTFGETPDEDEVDRFITEVKAVAATAEETVLACARIHNEFTERFGGLIDRDEGPLTDEEKALFAEAIEFMDADERLLSHYVRHVDEELAKQMVEKS